MMRGDRLFAGCIALFLFIGLNLRVYSQESAPPPPAPDASASDTDTVFRVNVDMVQLNVEVIDRKGNYVTGLRPTDFAIVEDSIPQKLATFEEGNQDPITLLNTSQPPAANPPASSGSDSGTGTASGSPQFSSAGANVFILFDTSNYMYRGFVFAQDSISDFVRSLEGVSKVALYSYSRDLDRVASLTADRTQVLRGIRSTGAGDDAALYNCVLLTVKDAAQLTGKKAIVVFSNGPDNASLVPPEDVAELAQ